MKPTTTKTLLATLLLFFITTGIMAQDKYEYATVAYLKDYNTATITISYSNKATEFIKIGKDEFTSEEYKSPVYKALLKTIEKMDGEGWQVIDIASTYTIGTNATYFLKRKKS